MKHTRLITNLFYFLKIFGGLLSLVLIFIYLGHFPLNLIFLFLAIILLKSY
jgi:hypothetical protein